MLKMSTTYNCPPTLIPIWRRFLKKNMIHIAHPMCLAMFPLLHLHMFVGINLVMLKLKMNYNRYKLVLIQVAMSTSEHLTLNINPTKKPSTK